MTSGEVVRQGVGGIGVNDDLSLEVQLPTQPEVSALAHTWRRWGVVVAVVLLLVFYVAMALSAARTKGLSYDEGEEIAIGYNVWKQRDFRMESANGDLVKRWATLPLLVSRPKFVPASNPYWRAGGPYEVAFLFFFREGNDPHALLWQCRVMVAILGVATGLLVFFCSRELFGAGGGLISLALFASSPSMLAFGGIVSTEMTVFLTLLGAAWSSWRLLQRVTWSRLAFGLLFAALLVLSKPTAVVMLPLAIVMIAIKLASRRPLRWELGVERLIRSRLKQLGVIAALLVAHLGCGWLAIWTCYDFRYLATPNPADPGIVFRSQPADPVDPRIETFLNWSRRTHFLPEGYLHGVEWLLQQNDSQAAFMDGQWKFGDWPTFFPYAIWVKTHPALLAALTLSVVAWWWRSRTERRRVRAMRDKPTTARSRSPLPQSGHFLDGTAPPTRELLYGAVPFLGLMGVYFAAAETYGLNIGFRHILPIYPAIYILCGALVFLWSTRRWLVRLAIVALVSWHVSSAAIVWPDFLAYFSPVAGGSDEGYKHLVDSSLDWGMDLPDLKRWLDVHNPGGKQPVFFSYFGVDDPDTYGIKSYRLPSRPNWRAGAAFPLTPGIYAISATTLQGVGLATVGPWNKTFEIAYQRLFREIETFDRTLNDPIAHAALLAKYPPEFWNREYATYDYLRFARLCAWLRHGRRPDANVGHSILIWNLDARDIEAAALGPPVELADKPLQR